jgi:hypothetical protein
VPPAQPAFPIIIVFGLHDDPTGQVGGVDWPHEAPG